MWDLTGPPATTALAVHPLHPSCPPPPLLPVWMKCFFNSLVVGLPWSLNFWQFWLLFVFKFAGVLLFVRESAAFLLRPPSWLELLGCFLQILGVSVREQILMQNIFVSSFYISYSSDPLIFPLTLSILLFPVFQFLPLHIFSRNKILKVKKKT